MAAGAFGVGRFALANLCLGFDKSIPRPGSSFAGVSGNKNECDRLNRGIASRNNSPGGEITAAGAT
jgi:hypothetical protein